MPVTARNQPPLRPHERPIRPARLSYTWLERFQACRHSALLYLRYKGATTSPQMGRGSLVHETLARMAHLALETGETKIPHEIAKALLLEVYAEGEFTVPAHEWDLARRCVFNAAEHFEFRPDKILGVEQLMVMDIAGWRISGKFDIAWRDDTTVGVTDFKSTPSPKTQEQWDQSFQAKLYSILMAYGYPVTVSECVPCSGSGVGSHEHDCPECQGRGYTETVEPYPLGEGAQHFDIAEVYPALAFDDGGLMERRRTMSRAELLDERSMLESLLAQVTKSFDSGEWPAVPSDEACSYCPARRDCPLPDQLLPFTGIDSQQDAEHYALAMTLLDQERKDIVKALKAHVKNGNAPVDLGNGTQLNFVKVEVNETDYNAFQAAQMEGPANLDDFRSKRIQTSFKPEPIPEPELTPDEKWGETLPESDLSTGQEAA